MATEPKLVDMAYSKAEMKAEQKEMAMGEPSPYPWGLCIRLEKDELDKLGVKDLPGVGDEMHLLCIAKVTGVNQSASQQAEHTSVALQITMMQVLLRESADDEKGEMETPASETKETKGTLLSAR